MPSRHPTSWWGKITNNHLIWNTQHNTVAVLLLFLELVTQTLPALSVHIIRGSIYVPFFFRVSPRNTCRQFSHQQLNSHYASALSLCVFPLDLREQFIRRHSKHRETPTSTTVVNMNIVCFLTTVTLPTHFCKSYYIRTRPIAANGTTRYTILT